jgi:hypothetical protein
MVDIIAPHHVLSFLNGNVNGGNDGDDMREMMTTIATAVVGTTTMNVMKMIT